MSGAAVRDTAGRRSGSSVHEGVEQHRAGERHRQFVLGSHLGLLHVPRCAAPATATRSPTGACAGGRRPQAPRTRWARSCAASWLPQAPELHPSAPDSAAPDVPAGSGSRRISGALCAAAAAGSIATEAHTHTSRVKHDPGIRRMDQFLQLLAHRARRVRLSEETRSLRG